MTSIPDSDFLHRTVRQNKGAMFLPSTGCIEGAKVSHFWHPHHLNYFSMSYSKLNVLDFFGSKDLYSNTNVIRI